MFAYLSPGTICFSNVFILDFLLVIVTENLFFACVFLELIKC